jgi:hypothetical protein
MIRYISDQLADLQRLLLDQFGPLNGFWRKLFQLHQLRIGQHHADSVVQVMDQSSDFVFVHKATNLHRIADVSSTVD